MALETKVRLAGTWETMTQIEVKSGGVWRDCTSVEVKVGGVWEQVFQITGTVTISGEVVSNEVTSGTARAGFRWNSDGTIDERSGGSYTQVDTGTDWIIPNGAAPSDYEVRWASTSSGGWTVAAATVTTWVALSSSREWRVEDTGPDSSTVCTCVFEIRKGSGSVLDSGTYTGTAVHLP